MNPVSEVLMSNIVCRHEEITYVVQRSLGELWMAMMKMPQKLETKYNATKHLDGQPMTVRMKVVMEIIPYDTRY